MTDLQALHILRNAWLHLVTPHATLEETREARLLLADAIAQHPIVLEYRHLETIRAWRRSVRGVAE